MQYSDHSYYLSSSKKNYSNQERTNQPREFRERDEYDRRDRDERSDGRYFNASSSRQDRYDVDPYRNPRERGPRQHANYSGKTGSAQGRNYREETERSKAGGAPERKVATAALQPLEKVAEEREHKRSAPSNLEIRERETIILHPLKKSRNGTANPTHPHQEEEYTLPERPQPFTLPPMTGTPSKIPVARTANQKLDEALQRQQAELASLFSKKNQRQKELSKAQPIFSAPKGTPFDFGASHSTSSSAEEEPFSLFNRSVNPDDYLKELEQNQKMSGTSYKSEAFQATRNCKIQQDPVNFLKRNYITGTKLGAGSFHDAFKEKGKDIVYRFPQPGLDRQFEPCVLHDFRTDSRIKVPYTVNILYHGFLSYKALEDVVKDMEGVRVANLYNNPVQDGYWKVEYVKDDVDVHDPVQLKKVGQCLKRMVDENRYVFPDFRPSNVKVDADGNIVIIDFCEDKTIDHFRLTTPGKLVGEYIEEWAGGNHTILKTLQRYAGLAN